MLASRVSVVTPFLAMEVYEKALEMERMGRKVIHMEIGEPDFDTPEIARAAAIEAIHQGRTHYTNSLGDPELRERIARHYAETYGVRVDPDQILCTSGSSPAMFLLFLAMLETGDEVILSNPGYPCYPSFIRFAGGNPVFINTSEEDGFRYDPDDVRVRITPRTKALIINSPCNPTGVLLGEERMKALASLGVCVISDEIYNGLTYGGQRDHTILEYTDNAIVVGGLSKAQAMTGWRLGYLILPKKMVGPIKTLAQSFYVCACSLSQRAGIKALDATAEVERMRLEYDARRKLMLKGVRDLGLRIAAEPEGAFYMLANARHLCTDSLKFSLELLENTGVGVTPGVDFGSQAEGFVRFSYTSSEENLREGLRRLKEYLERRPG